MLNACQALKPSEMSMSWPWKRGAAAGRVPVEEHHDEQRHAADAGDQVALAEPAQFHAAPACGRAAAAALAASSVLLQQHRDRHRPDAAGDRRDQPGALGRRTSKSTSPTRPLVGAVDPDVDHRRARLDPLARDHARAADGGDEHVGAAADLAEVAGARVADGHGGVGGQQQRGERAADEVRAPDHDRLGALQRDVVAAQQLHHARRSAGTQPGPALREQARRDRRQAVDVLARPGSARSAPGRRPGAGSGAGAGSRTRAGRRRAARISVSTSSWEASWGSRWSRPTIPTSAEAFCLLPT